jgi:hypothetical protein
MNPREQDRASRKDLGQRPSRSPWPAGLVTATIAAGLALECCRGAFAQIPATLNGPPVQVQPYVAEPGVPLITINPGTVNPFTGVDGDGSGTGSSGDGTGDSGGGTAASSTALDTLLAQSWGAAAIANAEQLGINPSALAATCVVESGCQNVAGSGTIAGAFQMSAATYTAMINQALANDPSLAGEITPGLAGQMDPATESIAAAEYLIQGAEALQAAGISDPTVLDTRAYYNFGPTNGVALAMASPNETVAAAMPNVSAATLAANGITPGETVGQWQAAVSAKIGNAANQSVLSG